jgi:hypothetical protein
MYGLYYHLQWLISHFNIKSLVVWNILSAMKSYKLFYHKFNIIILSFYHARYNYCESSEFHESPYSEKNGPFFVLFLNIYD